MADDNVIQKRLEPQHLYPDNQKMTTKKKTNKRSRAAENQNHDRPLAPLTSFKKIHVDLTDLAPPSSSSNDESGVFDFPWMKEGAMKSDFKIEDAFASSLVDACGMEDDRLIVTGKCGWMDFRDQSGCGKAMCDKEEEDDADDDGLECVWDSLLNQQPLSNIELFEAGGF